MNSSRGALRPPDAGFTVVELMVVIGVVAVLMAVITLGIRRASQSFDLRRASEVAASELRRAQAAAVGENSTYTVEFVLTNPGAVNVYRLKAATESCPAGMVAQGSTVCIRTVRVPEWPKSVAVVSAGTTFPACAAPANGSNKCAVYQPMGNPASGGTAQLRNSAGTTWQVIVAAATGRVSVQR